MPTYDYECQRCGHTFERFQSMTEAPLKRCPKCNGKVQRMIGTGAGLLFKGSGFYITDYRNESYREAQKKEQSSTSSAGDSSAKTKKSDEAKKPNKAAPAAKASTKGE